MKVLILAVLVTAGLGTGLSDARAQTGAYKAPPHNYYQNNWMSR
jgi:hypothetical protein